MAMIVIGTVFVDVKGYPIGMYNAHGRNAGRVQYVHGGVGRNIAEDLGNIGVRPVFVSLLDESGSAADVIRRLEEHDVDTRYMLRTPDGMGTWLAVFNNSNDVAAEVSVRPNLMPIIDIIREHGDEMFADADSVLLELDMDTEIVREIYAMARKHGVPVYAAVANMDLALFNRFFLRDTECFVCNEVEAGKMFSVDYGALSPEEIRADIAEKVQDARLPNLVVTLGERGAVYADLGGHSGMIPAVQVPIADTTGAGDAFFAGVSAGLTYGQTLEEACRIGTRLAASVICKPDNTCPQFLPAEFGLQIDKE